MPQAKSDTEFYVICYDVPDDKRRGRIHKTLSAFGQWRQYSLFECYLTRQQVVLLRARLADVMHQREDTIRLYALCDACRGRVQVLGRGDPPHEDEMYIL